MMTAFWLWLTSPLTQYATASNIFAAACFAVAVLTPAWLPIKREYLLIAGGIAVASSVFFWYAFRAGEAHEAQRVAANEGRATENVDGALSKIAMCRRNGGAWNTVNGMCE